MTLATAIEDRSARPAAGTPALTLGGQAVIEGVMLRSPRFVSIAVRTPQRGLLVETRAAASSALTAAAWRRAPFVRGIAVLADGLLVGTWALMTSARAGQPAQALSAGRVRLVLVRSLIISIVLFFLLPAVLVRYVAGNGPPDAAQNWLEGVLRIALVLAFLVAIGRIPAIRRVFQYHGAEHKVINAYEAGVPLRIESAARMSRFHPRCGTTFLLTVLLVAIVVFAALGRPPLAVRLVERLLFLPVVASVSYEIIRLAGRLGPLRPLLGPGLWLQRLTTEEPDAAQLSVALAALDALLPLEGR